MSKFTTAAATSHTLSLAAMEEASRTGERTAGVDHLLLALVVSEQAAGQVLRSFGITLDTAREAVAAQHAAQLAALGITAAAPPSGRITFHETGDYRWGEQALDILTKASKGSRQGDASAVLRELIAEPSGFVEAVLRRLGAEVDEVRTRLAGAEQLPGLPHAGITPAVLTGSAESFVPAPPEHVWALLDDPARFAEWEPGTASVEDVPERVCVGSSWRALTRTERPDGKPLRVNPHYRASLVELTAREPLHLIEWRFSWPDAPRSNTKRIRIALEQAAGGTQLRTSLAWERNLERGTRIRRLLQPLLRPVHRFVIWMQLTQLGAGISRAFR